MEISNAIPRIAQNVESMEFDGEAVVYSPQHNKGYYLNSTSAWLWKSCDGQHRLDDLATEMAQEFECGVADVRSDIEDTLRKLLEAGLLEIECEVGSKR